MLYSIVGSKYDCLLCRDPLVGGPGWLSLRVADGNNPFDLQAVGEKRKLCAPVVMKRNMGLFL